MDFIETAIFHHSAEQLLTAEEQLRLQADLVANPQLGTLIPGSRGLRKARWSCPRPNQTDGEHLVFYWPPSESSIVLLLICPSHRQEDLTWDQLKLLRQTVEA